MFWLLPVIVLCVLTLAPNTASASVFSLFTPTAQADTNSPDANTGVQNSQKMALATPDVGPDILNNDTDDATSVTSGDTAIDPTMGPAGTSLDVANLPTSDQISVYTVHAGDTLKSVAKIFDVSTATIAAANGLTPDQALVPGTVLEILPVSGEIYTVKTSDTLKSIAAKFSTKDNTLSASDVAFDNDLSGDSDLVVGDTIIIPNPDFDIVPPTKNNSGSKSVSPKGVANPWLPDVSADIVTPLHDHLITQGAHMEGRAVDIGAPKGTPILAAASGTVLIAMDNGKYNLGAGNYIVIDSTYNGVTFQCIYEHESEILVTAGETVTQGQEIGKVGDTGDATGPHVHFEMRGAQNPFTADKVGTILH